MDEFTSFIKDVLILFFPKNEQLINRILENKDIMKTFKKAFTPKSVNKIDNYEGLEKVGDAIFDVNLIKYIASEYIRLYKKTISESQLAYTKDWFKSNFRMTQFAEELMLGEYIEGKSVEKDRGKVLADVFEAFIGAMDFAFCEIAKIDGSEEPEVAGFPYTYKFVKSLFVKGGKFEINFEDPNAYKDPTTIVNEVLKNQKKYEIEQPPIKDPIDGWYYATIKIKKGDQVFNYIGRGRKKKEAKLSVALEVIKAEKIDYAKEVKKREKISAGEFYLDEDGNWFVETGGKKYLYKSMSMKEAMLQHLKDISKK